jgi:hypothetical protein
MTRSKLPRRRTPRTFKSRLFLETLEDRNLMSTGQWFAVFSGMTPAPTLDEQAGYGQNLLTASGVTPENVHVLSAVDFSGAFLVQTPTDVTQQTLTAELQSVPGFTFVQEYTREGWDTGPDHPAGRVAQEKEDGGDLINRDFLKATYGEFNYQRYVTGEQNGEVPPQGGPVPTTAGTNDALTNNNTGSSGTAFFTQSETSVIAFGNTVLVAFNDSGSNAGSNKFTGFARSTDGGVTWTDGGTLPTNVNGDAGDPVLARDNTTGRIYFATLQFSGSGMDVFHSDDGGATWSAPVQGAPGKNGLQDKEWIAVDNFSGAGNGNLYLVERDFGSGNGIYFFRSTNQGATFGPNGGTLIASGNQGAFVTVGPDHAVYVF